jgi:hypothetical protein
MALSPTQRRALLYAWSEDWSCCPDPQGDVHPNTVRGLVKRGWLVPEAPDEFDEEYAITDAGRQALGVVQARPKTVRTALAEAGRQLLGVDLDVLDPDHLGQQWFGSDDEPRDFEGALAVIDRIEDPLAESFEFGDYGADAAYSCFAQLATEWGFPCVAEVSDDVVSYWPED